MAGVMTAAEKIRVLADIVQGQGNLSLRLFENNMTPDANNNWADFTECTFDGYAAVELDGNNWTVIAAGANYAAQTVSSNNNQTAKYSYGYYLTRGANNDVVGAERFSDGPYTIALATDTIEVTPNLPWS